MSSDDTDNSPYGKPANADEAMEEIADGGTQDGIAHCPVTEEFIYLYPTRYALVEKDVEHPALAPGFDSLSKPIGVRLARKGFVYLFHSLKPDELLSFEIQDDSQQSVYWNKQDSVGKPSVLTAPIKLLRQGFIEVVYSEVAWTDNKITEVKSDSRLRRQYMQRVDLDDYDFGHGAKHLVPLSSISTVLSECMDKNPPEPFSENEPHLPFEKIGFSWSSLPLAPASKGKVMVETKGSSYNTALLVLHDILGVLHDIDMHAECIYREKREWYENNKQALHAGQFVQGLYQVSEGDLSNHFKQDQATKNLEPLDQQSLKDYTRVAELRYQASLLRIKAAQQKRYGQREKLSSNWTQRFKELNAKADELEAQAEHLEEQLACQHGHHAHYKDAVEQYSKGKLSMLKDDSPWNIPRIEQRVRLKPMKAFLANAEQLAEHIADLEEDNSHDRNKLLPRINNALWYFDILVSDQVKHLHETHFRCIANLCGDAEGKGVDLAHKLYIDEFGEENRASLFITNYSIESANEINNASNTTDDLKTILSTANDVSELKSLLKLDQFPELTEHLELRGSIIAALTPAYIREVTRTFGQLNNLDTMTRARRVIRHTNVSFDLLLVNAAANDNLMIRLPNAEATNEFQRALNELGQDQGVIRTLKNKRKNIRQQIKKAQQRRDWATNQALHQELEAIKQTSVEKWQSLQNARATVLAYTSPVDPTQGMSGFKIEGLSDVEINTLNQHIEGFRSGMLTNYGQGHTLSSVGSSIRAIFIPVLLSITNIFNAFSTLEETAHKEDRSLLDQTEIAADVIGAFTATASVGVELWRQSIEGGIQRGNPFLVNTLGKVVIISTLFLSFIDGLGALSDNVKKFKEVSDALEDDDYIAAAGNATSILGNTFVLVGNARQGYYAFKAFEYARLHGMNYGAALARFAGPIASAMPWLVIGGVFILIGEALYEIYKSPPIMVWVERCYWGRQSQGWSYQEEQQQLADAIMRPRIEAQYYVEGYTENKQYDLHAQSVRTHNMVDITISIPGIKRSSFVVSEHATPIQQSESPLQIGIAVTNNYQEQDITFYLLNTASAAFNHNMLQLKLFVSREALKNASSLSFKFISRPDMAYKPVQQAKNYVRYTVKLDEFQYKDDDKPGMVPALEDNDTLPGEQRMKLFAINDAWLNYAEDPGETDV
ncbi:toxin VasX [Zooshikella ganghwensis]|uniref:toxin VasX n=1 Tax=Zooshikella ganghwensis TaxID=202772 RepID=UPI00040A691E|nr:toxin VasX [Zooshikella ganghwensis]